MAMDESESGRLQSLYDRHVMPRLVNLACSSPAIESRRRRVIPEAEGIVVEIGFGSGLNLAHYDRARVEKVIGVDPVAEMTELGRRRLEEYELPIEVISAGAEDMPLESNSADTVILAFTGCTIPEIDAAMAEMARVIKPDGRLLFAEHGLAPDEGVARWQHRLNDLWKRFSGGCNLNRDVPGLLRSAGFEIVRRDSSYLSWTPRFLGYVTTGEARLG
ncbi:MAG: class I SAM-dependent methyltransferase [Xanthomonadales bacterium]|nr:class I SAM-dependent methyltransferase [Xanthomonadales bacterium]